MFSLYNVLAYRGLGPGGAEWGPGCAPGALAQKVSALAAAWRAPGGVPGPIQHPRKSFQP